MNSVYFLISLLGTTVPLISTRRIEFYRKDYTYFEQYNAFYKMHWDLDGQSWDAAFQACNDEEATLFYPRDKYEWTIVKNLTDALPKRPNGTDIFIGLHDKFGMGEFTTVDGDPMPSSINMEKPEENLGDSCVLMTINTGNFRLSSCTTFPFSPVPFVCKKYDYEYCPTVDIGYKYVKSSKKCYKIHKRPRTWDQAVRTCYMENSTLIILENTLEAAAIHDMLTTGVVYHTGIRKFNTLGEYYTIKGQNMGDVYNMIRENYNDNEDMAKDCGALRNSNYLYTTTTNCKEVLPFICEMKPHSM